MRNRRGRIIRLADAARAFKKMSAAVAGTIFPRVERKHQQNTVSGGNRVQWLFASKLSLEKGGWIGNFFPAPCPKVT